MTYDTPAAGPNTISEHDKRREGPDQAFSSPILEDDDTTPRTSSVDRPASDIFPVHPPPATTLTIASAEERNARVSKALRALFQEDRHSPNRKLPKVAGEAG
ncbi:hypothetical protein FRC00_012796, partial [Tulasnella sp. 408]